MMVTPSEKLAESLEALRKLQDHGIIAIQASDLSRTHRECCGLESLSAFSLNGD